MTVSLQCDEVAERLWVGSYPQSTDDLDHLQAALGVDAVLSLQSDADLARVAHAADALWFAGMQRGIAMVRVAIDDHDANDLRRQLPEAVESLAELLQSGYTVYLHCTLGLNRSPTVAIAYLARHGGMTLEQASAQVRSRHRCVPYESLVQAWLDR